jgi:hypothetical protein
VYVSQFDAFAYVLLQDGNPVRFFRVREGRIGEPDIENQVVTELVSGKKVRIRRWMSCKPWRGSRCAVYHEHKETDACGELFMGR